jgi:hypothetical protein
MTQSMKRKFDAQPIAPFTRKFPGSTGGPIVSANERSLVVVWIVADQYGLSAIRNAVDDVRATGPTPQYNY